MNNMTYLIGRLTSDPEIKELEDGKKVCNICVAVPRSYKNAEGAYDTDFLDCTLWNGVGEKLSEYCKKGDLIGIKGRIETSTYEKVQQKVLSRKMRWETLLLLKGDL